ncbi:hypothetical protein TNIN_300631 [Trichonephila inaurata madagascariensis]|uniref:Uncharacterized protein n=1 Tax=Trichonephila inaurata madagascariensis TaxID=2747483 RepID=A0A8X7C870_9ARAC|nr:hypothetical protein TNIN_300631 [Trichonephila inaurata madagascariensis]
MNPPPKNKGGHSCWNLTVGAVIVNLCVPWRGTLKQKRLKCRRFQSKLHITDLVSLPAGRREDAAFCEAVGIDLSGQLFLKRDDKLGTVINAYALFSSFTF